MNAQAKGGAMNKGFPQLLGQGNMRLVGLGLAYK